MNERKLGKSKLVFGELVMEAPQVVAVVSGEEAAKDASLAEGLGADLVEVRLDLLPGDPIKAIIRVREATSLPIIATNRLAAEGGGFRGGEVDRIAILAEASAWADLVDVELRAERRDRLLEMVDVPVIISYHDFEGTPPPELTGLILAEIFEAGADIAKLAVTPSTQKACLDLLELLLNPVGPTSILGMGEVGRHLRFLAPIYGSVLTYGYVRTPTAPGQIPVKTLKGVLEVLMDHPVVDGVERKVDGKKVTEGWKVEDPSEFEEQVIAFIEETGGDIDVDAIKAKLGMSEGQFMQVIEYLQEQGILE